MKIEKDVFVFIFLFLFNGLFSSGCSESESTGTPETSGIVDVLIPEIITGVFNSDIEIIGEGLQNRDLLLFSSIANPYLKFEFSVNNVTDTGVTINIGSEISSGNYSVYLVRDTQKKSLGDCMLSICTNAEIPNESGKNIKGIVSCNGKGIPNVVVSDGMEITKTDANGIYYLESGKEHGYVFISIPSNYEVPTKNNLPFFFQYLTSDKSITDQRDFELVEVDNSEHMMVLMADMHLANRNNDINQFQKGFYSEVSSFANKLKNTGVRVYGLTLGDMTWDSFWYFNSFALPEYLNEVKDIGFQIFNTMGNHDNDPYKTGDFSAESTFKKVIGPTYYSFNIGNVHYVVLDNIEYINTGGAEGTIGSKDYDNGITTQQMGWLSKDLATITDRETPIVVALHIPVHSSSINSDGVQENKISLNNGEELKTLLSEFSNVHIFSGHAHCNCNFDVSDNIYEHNVAAICGTWWGTGADGYADNCICKDGSPGGYGLFEVNGKDVKYYFKGTDYERTRQFRTYDRNSIEITADIYAPDANTTYRAKVPDYAGEYYYETNNNKVYINVFSYDNACKLEVTENGTVLKVTRKLIRDPLHIISYEMQRLNHNAEPTDEFVTYESKHMFEVSASSATSTLKIKLTDRYGNEYSETMTRPKELKTSMK